jgi:hypothetical protein
MGRLVITHSTYLDGLIPIAEGLNLGREQRLPTQEITTGLPNSVAHGQLSHIIERPLKPKNTTIETSPEPRRRSPSLISHEPNLPKHEER